MSSERFLVTALVVALGWASSFFAAHADDFTIAERGKSACCSIELPPAPTEVERYAAEELRDWTEKLTGIQLPIGGPAVRCVRIVRGTSDLGDDGFRLTVRNGALEISGNRRGSLYGVYEILERFGGIGWFSRIRTVVPSAERLSVPGDLDDRQVPAFVKREILWMDAIEPVFAARLRAHGHYQPALPKTGERTYYTGGGQEPCNSFFRVLNRTPGNAFKDHPEYYSEVGGKRIPDGQLCLSNPDVIRIYTANLLDIIRSDPKAPQFIVSIEDCLGFCTCPRCKAIDEREGGPSGSVITFVNRVAEDVVKEFPHVRILTNAYLYMLRPPKHVKPHPSVLVTFCPIEVDRRNPIATGRNPANVEALAALKGWAEITKDMFVWDYTTDYIGFLTPFPNVLTFQPNLKLYRACGITGGMMQGDNSGIHGEFAELKAWLLAKLMWNPDLPVEPLLDRFFRGYYGAAAPIVRTYFDELNSLGRDEMKHPLKVMHEEPTSQVLPNSFLRRGRWLWRQAEEAVRDDPECSYLVRMGALSVDYTTLARSNFDYDVRRSPMSESVSRQRRELAASVVGRFREAERREGIRIALAEGRNPEVELKRLERIASGDERIVTGKDGAVVISPNDLVTWGRRFGSFVGDPKAPGGRAYEVNLENCAWSAEFPLSKVRFDRNVRYRLRALVGVTKDADAGDVPSMECGIIDRFARKEVGKVSLTSSQLRGGYSWYDVCTFVPGNGQVVWFGVPERGGSPAALKSMRVAGLEISVIGDVGIRPVGADGQDAFWNAHAERFMYPPQFGFAAVDGAERYRFKVITDAHVALDFEDERPDAFLSPVWDWIPENGFVTVLCFALDGRGCETALAGVRRFFKVAAFKEGAYPKAKRPYSEAARMVYDYIFGLPSTRHFLETGRPDMRYELNTYPTKMHSALVRAMVRYTKLRPDRAAEALKLAHLAADYLISISQPAGAPLAFMPPTYEGDGLPGYNDKGENMLVYPAHAGRAYLALHGVTGETKYLEAARRIAETYLKLQGEDGTCYLKIREKDGEPVAPNRTFPLGICEFLVQLGDVTGEGRYRAAADRGFELIDRGPLRTWNWEGQFEDVKPSEHYHNLTLHSPCATALYVLQRYPGDARRIAQARQLLDFSEDQFVVWERPCRPDGIGARSLDRDGRPTNADDAHYLKWSVPGVLEQYRCYVPIDSAAAKVMRTCLAVHRATGDAVYLAKARALADSLVTMQQPSGRIQTFWRETPENEPLKNDWINCMIASADALAEFAEYAKEM